MTVGAEAPAWTIETLRHRPSGQCEVLVRLAGGRRVKVVVPAVRANDAGIMDAIAVAVDRLPRPPGPNT